MDNIVPVLFFLFAIAAFAWVHHRKKKRGWNIMWSEGVPKKPTAEGDGWVIELPNAPGHLNYVQNFSPPSLKGKTQLVARFKIEGSGFARVDPDTDPTPSLGLIIQRKGDRGTDMGYRWFSHAALPLEVGEFTIAVPLNISEWGDVMGGNSEAAFAAAMEDVESIGVVFGSAGGRGHGVFTTEQARVRLLSLVVT